jgi:tetratricopeptide (TPR) repeat protein
MVPAPDDPTELDSADLVEDTTDPKTAIKREPKSKPSRPRVSVPARASAAPPPVSQRPPQITRRPGPPPLPTLPDADALVAEARKRAEITGQLNDRVARARARHELAVLLEVVKRDVAAAVAEYRAAHAIAPSALAPITSARRLTPFRPIAPALALLDTELKSTSDPRARVSRFLELGRLLLAGGATPEKAAQAFRDLLATTPQHPGGLRGLERALRTMPRALENQANLDALATHLETMALAWRADRQLSAWLEVERAQLLERLHRPEAARAALEQAMDLDGGLGPVRAAYTRHLIVHQEIGLLVNAWAAEAALEGDTPRAGRLLYAAARLASERLEQTPLAVELYRRATALQATAVDTRRGALRELLRLYQTRGDVESALEAEEQLLLWVEGAERAYRYRRLALAYERIERWDAAANHARQALAAVPDDDETRDRLDRAFAALGQHDQRITLWTAEASRVTNAAARVEAFRRAAEVAEKDQKRQDLALVELRAAWSVDSDDTETADDIARLLTTTAPPNPAEPGDPARARARIDFFTEAADRATEPGRKIAMLEKLAQIWEDEVRAPTKALEVYREILTVDPERRSAVLGLQRSAARSGDAKELFRALVLEADSCKNATLERSLLLRAAEIASERLNDADSANDLVQRVLAKNAGDMSALRTAVRIHQRIGRYDEAVAQLRLMATHVRKGPAAFAIAVEIASLLDRRARKRDEAIAAYRDAFRIDPSHPLPPAEIRRILVGSDDHRALAEELTQMAAGLADREPRARMIFEAAEIFADRLDEMDRALVLLSQAHALSPHDQEITERLTWAYVRENRSAELVTLLESKPELSPSEKFSMALILSQDRDLPRAAALLSEVLATEPKSVPALRTLEHCLVRTEQFSELGVVLRSQAATFTTEDARLGAIHELVALEEHRGVVPPSGSPPASDLLRGIVPDDLLLHESVLRRGLVADTSDDAIRLTHSINVLASAATDHHYAAMLQLVAALLIERSSMEHAQHLHRDALRRYRLALDGWPECLTAARGMKRLAERISDGEAFVEAASALGHLETERDKRAQMLTDAAEGLVARRVDTARALELFCRALGEDPDAVRAATGVLSLALEGGGDAGQAADALRRALERTKNNEQTLRIGSGLAKLAFERLSDPTVALEALRRVRKKVPGHVGNLLALADACLALHLWSDAAETAQSALGITRDPAERCRAAVALAEAHLRVPETKASARREAEEAERMVDSAPITVRAELFSRLGMIYLSLDEPNASERVLIRAVLFGGQSTKPLELLAQAFSVSTFDGAEAYYRALGEIIKQANTLKIAIEPGWVATMGKLEATLLFSKPRDGLGKLKDAILLDPARIESYEALAEVYGTLGAREEAVRELLNILPEVAARGVPVDRMIRVFSLVGRECKLARATAQAAAVDAVVAYLSRDTSRPPTPVPFAAPVPMSLVPSILASTVVPPDPTRPWAEVSGYLLDLMPKLLRIDPLALGLSPRDRLPVRASHPLRALCDRFTRAFGEVRFDLFVDAAGVGVPRVIPSDPPAMVLPRGYGDLSENEQAVGVCRLLVYLALSLPWLEELSNTDLDGLLFGSLRAGDETWNAGQLSAAAEANAEVWRPRIVKVAGRRHKRGFEEIAQRAQRYADPQNFRQTIRLASMRVAYLLTGDLASSLNHLVRIDRELSQAPRDAVAQKLLLHPVGRDLIFFSLAPTTVGLRQSVGTA